MYALQSKKLTGTADIFLLVALLLGQDDVESTKSKKSDGMRIFLLFFIIAFFIITTGYKGALFSCLAFRVVPKPISELPEQRIIIQL